MPGTDLEIECHWKQHSTEKQEDGNVTSNADTADVIACALAARPCSSFHTECDIGCVAGPARRQCAILLLSFLSIASTVVCLDEELCA